MERLGRGCKGEEEEEKDEEGEEEKKKRKRTNKKTKILASELRRKIHGQKIWVDTVILLTDERARANLRDPQAHRVIHIEDARSYFADPNNLPHRTQKIKHLHHDITEFFMGVTRPRKRIEVIGLYDVVERISQNEERTVFLGKHRYIKTRPETILKVFHFDMYSSELGSVANVSSAAGTLNSEDADGSGCSPSSLGCKGSSCEVAE